MEQIAQKNHFKCEQTDMYQYTSAVSIKTKGGEWGGGDEAPWFLPCAVPGLR